MCNSIVENKRVLYLTTIQHNYINKPKYYYWMIKIGNVKRDIQRIYFVYNL